MYSYDFFMNTAPITLFYMLLSGEIQEYQVPDECWNDIGFAGEEYRNEIKDLCNNSWTLEQETCFIINDLLTQDVVPTYGAIEEQSSVSYGFDTLMETMEIQELIQEVNGAYILTESGKKLIPHDFD
jgi:hypothetical protein